MVELFSQKFHAQKELIQYARSFYASEEYALSIKDSKKDRYVVLCCDRNDHYQNRQKITISNRKKASCT